MVKFKFGKVLVLCYLIVLMLKMCVTGGGVTYLAPPPCTDLYYLFSHKAEGLFICGSLALIDWVLGLDSHAV